MAQLESEHSHLTSPMQIRCCHSLPSNTCETAHVQKSFALPVPTERAAPRHVAERLTAANEGSSARPAKPTLSLLNDPAMRFSVSHNETPHDHHLHLLRVPPPPEEPPAPFGAGPLSTKYGSNLKPPEPSKASCVCKCHGRGLAHYSRRLFKGFLPLN